MNQFNLAATDEKKPKFPFGLPLAEKHVHISLALSQNVFLRRIKQKRTDIDPGFLINPDSRYYMNLAEHHAIYERMRYVTSTHNELKQVTQAYLELIADEGAIYAEISNSFRDPNNFEMQMDAITEAIQHARINRQIETRIVVTVLRGDNGPERAEAAARYLAKNPRAHVTAFGIVGDEGLDCFADYERAFAIAFHEAGLGLVPHVAEQYLHNAIDFLHTVPKEALSIRPDDHRRLRAGHASLIHCSTQLMEEFAAANICIESLISANKRIGLPEATRRMKVGDTIESGSGRRVKVDRPLRDYWGKGKEVNHPLTVYTSRGIPVCLGSDNPLLQNTNIGKEYSLAVKAGITDLEQLLNITANAIRFANVDNVTRLALMQKVDLYRAQMKAGQLPDHAPNGYRRSYTM